jgi:hypothetical protein
MAEEYVEKDFYCPLEKKKIKVNLARSLVQGKSNFPVSYMYIHGPVNDILTTLYIDANLSIRGVESVYLNNEDNIFSKEQTREMMLKLMEEFTAMQKENERLVEELKYLRSELKKFKK